MGDGEVSPEEAYQLGQWLNNHLDAATTWPGSKLIQPRQEIWADGKVNKRDLHRLARLLDSAVARSEYAFQNAAHYDVTG
jgi:hypothetical protein